MADDYAKLLNPAQATTEAEFEAIWERLKAPLRKQTQPTEGKEQIRVPRVGTLTQRSSVANRRKMEALLETPPPPPPRRRDAAQKAMI